MSIVSSLSIPKDITMSDVMRFERLMDRTCIIWQLGKKKKKKGEPQYVMKGRRINIKGITVLCLCSGYYLIKGIVNSKVGS